MKMTINAIYRCTLTVLCILFIPGCFASGFGEDIPDCCRKEYEALMRELHQNSALKRPPSTLARLKPSQAESFTSHQGADGLDRSPSTKNAARGTFQLPNPETVAPGQRTQDRFVINYRHRADAFDSANLRRAATRPDLIAGLAENYQPPKHLGPLIPCPRPPPIQLFLPPRPSPVNAPPPPSPFEKRIDHYVF
ncbi:hypothetical protein RvY_16390 [Ramazzottius varieornatus]|uniref:Uncharacterized protein n=1 Tax=Ramazzottius varieornatus TaxID=947166 RepID=A0A1D1VZ54_RAMVA|nr:hypothetical protein RvY_16390 [Ramazzottius varieornatus]